MNYPVELTSIGWNDEICYSFSSVYKRERCWERRYWRMTDYFFDDFSSRRCRTTRSRMNGRRFIRWRGTRWTFSKRDENIFRLESASDSESERTRSAWRKNKSQDKKNSDQSVQPWPGFTSPCEGSHRSGGWSARKKENELFNNDAQIPIRILWIGENLTDQYRCCYSTMSYLPVMINFRSTARLKAEGRSLLTPNRYHKVKQRHRGDRKIQQVEEKVNGQRCRWVEQKTVHRCIEGVKKRALTELALLFDENFSMDLECRRVVKRQLINRWMDWWKFLSKEGEITQSDEGFKHSWIINNQ